MRVYRCIDTTSAEYNYGKGTPTAMSIRIDIGTMFVQSTDGEHYNNISYPVSAKLVENNPDKFEFLFDDTEHDKDYYISRKYSQYELDNALKNK